MKVYAFNIEFDELWKAEETPKGRQLIAILKIFDVVGATRGSDGQHFLFESRERRDKVLEIAKQLGFETADIIIDSGEIDDAYRRN